MRWRSESLGSDQNEAQYLILRLPTRSRPVPPRRGEDCFLIEPKFNDARAIAPEGLLALDKCFPATAFGVGELHLEDFGGLLEGFEQIWRICEHALGCESV